MDTSGFMVYHDDFIKPGNKRLLSVHIAEKVIFTFTRWCSVFQLLILYTGIIIYFIIMSKLYIQVIT